MTVYQYKHPHPFEDALRYDYAPCQSRQFIEAWQHSRLYAKSLFEKLVQNSIAEEVSNQIVEHTEDKQSLTTLLGGENKDVIWRFIKKYEVFGRLYSHYTPEWRKHGEAENASLDEYIIFAKSLTDLVSSEKSLQYLSTLLKLMDSFCSLESVTPMQARQLVMLIDNELSLISGLIQQQGQEA